MTKRLSPSDVAERQGRDQQAVASLTIEGMAPTAEEDALFAEFDRLGLSDEECRKRLLERVGARAPGVVVPAE